MKFTDTLYDNIVKLNARVVAEWKTSLIITVTPQKKTNKESRICQCSHTYFRRALKHIKADTHSKLCSEYQQWSKTPQCETALKLKRLP